MNRYEVFRVLRRARNDHGQAITEIEMKNLSCIVPADSPEHALDKAKHRFPRWGHSLAVQPENYRA